MKVIKRVLFIVFIILIIAISLWLVLIQSGYNMYKDAINNMSLADKVEVIKQDKYYTSIEEVPKMCIDAVIAAEDHRFYKHGGIDLISIARAVITDIKEKEFVQGGSTITQQLAKNMYFTQEKKIDRKIAEVFMAFDIEKNYNKDEILELYFNTSYYGNGYYTLKQACNGYFNKELDQMTDYECIYLAGIPNAPSAYAPTKNPELAKQRQKQVIDKMIKYGYLTEKQVSNILNNTK